MDRRSVLKMGAALGAGAAASACATPRGTGAPGDASGGATARGGAPGNAAAATARTAGDRPVVQLPPSPAEILREAPPVHLPRAYEVLERENLDALVVQVPVNAYYLTGWWPATSRMSGVPGLVAILARRRDTSIGVVTGEFTYYYLLSDLRYAYPFEVFLHSGPADEAELATARAAGYATEPRTGPSRTFADRGLVPLSERERARAAATGEVRERHAPGAAPDFALVKALRAFGLERARIGIDDEALRATLSRAVPAATVLSADSALKRMRLVKSPRELALHRIAAQANAEAALEMTRTVRAGATLRELRTVFHAAAAARGNRPVFMVLDGVSAEGVDATLRDGQAFLFDAVSEGAGYHGDFARTVFVGEPPRAMRDVTAAIRLGWDEVRAALKPGLRYSEITALGRETVRKAGYDFLVGFAPHSVGLYHQDAAGLGDTVLEPGMVLSVDCPVMQAGVGGTAHLEDLMLITAAGAEPIHAVSEAIVQV